MPPGRRAAAVFARQAASAGDTVPAKNNGDNYDREVSETDPVPVQVLGDESADPGAECKTNCREGDKVAKQLPRTDYGGTR